MTPAPASTRVFAFGGLSCFTGGLPVKKFPRDPNQEDTMGTRLAEQSVKCSFHLTNKTLWILQELTDKFTRNTGGVIQVTRTEILELAIRMMARNEGVIR